MNYLLTFLKMVIFKGIKRLTTGLISCTISSNFMLINNLMIYFYFVNYALRALNVE